MKTVKHPIKVDFANRRIVISKSFAIKAAVVNSKEYIALTEVQESYPDYKIEIRQIKRNPQKETYPGLTYEYMRDYIILHTTPEEELAAVAEFNELLMISRCQSKSRRYPIIKKWFLAKYPEVKEFGLATVVAAERERAEAELEAA